MKLFSPLYRLAMTWSRHPCAPWYLGGLSFAESSFFPVPPDVMLAPMSLANPRRAMAFALLTTLTSVAGGLFGYAIGLFAIDAILPWLQESRYWPAYETAVAWFDERGGGTRENGEHFRRALLAPGGSVDAMETWRNFRGRNPEIGPYLERKGLA